MATKRRRNRKITSTTSAIVPQQRERDVVQRVADRHRAVVDRASICTDCRQLRLEARQRRAHRVDHLDGVGVGLALDRRARSSVSPLKLAAVLTVSKLSSTCATSRSRTGLPLRVADDQVGELGRVAQLPVGLQGQRLRGPSSVPTGVLALAARERGGQLVER